MTYLFTSLLGGIATAAIGCGLVVVMPSNTHHERAMQEFVRQALTVTPTILTIWSWFTANIQQGVEDGHRNLANMTADPEPGSTQLVDFSRLDVSV